MGRCLLLLGLLAALQQAVAGQNDTQPAQGVRPDQLYLSREPGSNRTAALIPNTAIAPSTVLCGAPLPAAPLVGVAAPEACSATCRATPGCGWFEHCGAQAGVGPRRLAAAGAGARAAAALVAVHLHAAAKRLFCY